MLLGDRRLRNLNVSKGRAEAMTKKNTRLPPEKHREQIEIYRQEQPRYETYREVLARVLGNGCRAAFPHAAVEARAKTLSSFAEKAVRKYPKYRDPAHELSDLCGARVIVQTSDQVRGVRDFIEGNFEVIEADDKEQSLGFERFGYRDMHYIVRLRADRDDLLGITAYEREQIGDRRAEIQVRTWVQHAWADTVHDRLYKTSIPHSPAMKRTSNLLAALLEEADRVITSLANACDSEIANYTAHSPRAEVEEEIAIQEILLDNEPESTNRPAAALRLCGLLAAKGDHQAVVARLAPHATVDGVLGRELRLALGHSTCEANANRPEGPEYAQGVRWLMQALEECERKESNFATNPRTHSSLHARILAHLARATARLPGQAAAARGFYARAYEHEPDNPYYLADMLAYEMHCNRAARLPSLLGPTLGRGIDTCVRHMTAGIEMPFSCFAAGRLALLLGRPDGENARRPPTYEALVFYARGIRHVLAGTYCIPSDALRTEARVLRDMFFAATVPSEFEQAIRLLEIAEMVRARDAAAKETAGPAVLVIAGGAASISRATLDMVRPILARALADFRGTVVAGGTTTGIPGCVGDVVQEINQGRSPPQIELVGYRPTTLPDDATPHPAYQPKRVGTGFGAEQILQAWADILQTPLAPARVRLLCIGGGPLSALDCHVGLGLGAEVGVMTGTGGVADEIAKDPLWAKVGKVLPLPADAKTVRAFVMPLPPPDAGTGLDPAAQEIHRRYVSRNLRRLPANLKPWDELPDTYKNANREQAAYAVHILETVGFEVRQVADKPQIFDDFTEEELIRMAKLEHGRWIVGRLREGWRLGDRDDSLLLHDCLVPWEKLPDDIKQANCATVADFPAILSHMRLEVHRK
jgi:ppGpp synthetase/RelA/SpoT-type nucleotidyltranferase